MKTITPRADQLTEQFGFLPNPAVMAYYSSLCEAELENAALVAALGELLAAQSHEETMRLTSCGTKLDNARERLSEAEMSARAALAAFGIQPPAAQPRRRGAKKEPTP